MGGKSDPCLHRHWNWRNLRGYPGVQNIQNISAGDRVRAANGEIFKALTNLSSVDLAQEDFENTPASWAKVQTSDTVKNFVGLVTTYLDDNFGLFNNLVDVWVQSFARGDKGGLTIGVDGHDLNYKANAIVGDGATIIVTDTGLTGGTSEAKHDLVVKANARSDLITLSGNFAPFSFLIQVKTKHPRSNA